MPTFGLIALLIGASVALEGLDFATSGEVYLASVRKLAEATTSALPISETVVSPVPPPPPPPAPPPPPPPPAEVISPPPTPVPVVEPVPPPPQVQPLPPPPPAPEPISPQPLPESKPPQPFPELLQRQDQFRNIEEEESPHDFVDPREVQQVSREIRDMRSQVKQLTSQLRKNPAFADELNKITAIAGELEQFNSAIRAANNSDGSLREVIQEFRDNQYWDVFNAIRAKVQLPQEIKQIESTLRRLDRTIKVKSVRNIGLAMGALEAKIAEMKNQIAAVKSALASGNIEEAQEAMQFFHEGGHPGEIEGTVYRIRDIKQMLRRVKDEAIRAEVDRVLQEVIDAFNAGEYRDARETLDEYADDLQRLIQIFVSASSRRGFNRQDSFSKIRNLEGLIRAKLQESDERNER